MIRPVTAAIARAWRRVSARVSDTERGSITAYIVFLSLALIVVCGVVFDAGGALSDRQRANDIAAQAARAGADQLLPAGTGQTPLIDVTDARATARTFLHREGVTGTVTATPVRVSVTVTITHQTTLLQAAGIDTLDVKGSATAQPIPGLVTAAQGSTRQGG